MQRCKAGSLLSATSKEEGGTSGGGTEWALKGRRSSEQLECHWLGREGWDPYDAKPMLPALVCSDFPRQY